MKKVRIQVGDIGTKLGGYVKHRGAIVDVSAATQKYIRFEPPELDAFQRDAVFITDGGDGGIHYIAQAADLSVSGVWKMQAIVQLPTGRWSSMVYEFRVYDNI